MKSETGLNRTSVGLKRAQWARMMASSRSGPQSNQRGIETQLQQPLRPAFEGASIEPAWD
mgnify:CR=1 FL=1